MIILPNADIMTQTTNIEEIYMSGARAPLLFADFLKKTMPKLAAPHMDSFPRTIKIPKSNDRLLKGDFEPARIITLNECPTYKGEFPIWFGSTWREIKLRGMGYRNGDSRYPSDFGLGDDIVHGILAGATGQGKSVTLNSITTTCMMEYPPWELSMVLLDAKVVEFARYAGILTFPHIRTIGATTDSGYIISVLETFRAEMMVRNAIFAASGFQNIMDFREKTGLIIPRILIDADEVQAMFKNAGNKAKTIMSLYDDFGRLGRSTGIHLLLASQEVGEIPDGTMSNVMGRLALGCMPKVSEKIIGNDGAKANLGIKGRLILNKNSADKDKKDNVEFTVPFQSGEVFHEQKKSLGLFGEEIGFKQPYSYYNENFKTEVSGLEDILKPLVRTNKSLILGEPSFVISSGHGLLDIDMSGKEIENIYIIGNTYNNIIRHMIQLKTNFKLMGRSVFHNVFYADEAVVEKSGLREISSVVEEFRDFDNWKAQFYFTNIYRRLLCMKADNYIFSGEECKDELDDLFYRSFAKGSKEDTELNRKRNYVLHNLLHQPEFLIPFGLNTVPAKEMLEAKIHIVSGLINFFTSLKLQSDRMTYDQLTPIYNWIIAPEKILGLGRSSKSTNVTTLEKLMMDAASANVRFILCGVNFDEIDKIAKVSRYSILDTVEAPVYRKFKIEDYPDSCPAMLAILYDRFSDTKQCKKFKKLAYDGEIFV